MNTTTGVSNFEPWPPENGFRHEMSKENLLEFPLVKNEPKDLAAIAAKKAKGKSDNKEMTH